MSAMVAAPNQQHEFTMVMTDDSPLSHLRSERLFDERIIREDKFTTSFSTLLTEEVSESDDEDDESSSVGLIFRLPEVLETRQELSPATSAYEDNTWGCSDDDFRRHSESSFDDAFPSDLLRSLSGASIDDSTMERSVSFHDRVQVREYAVTVDCQCPHATPQGLLCPLTLDWTYSSHTKSLLYSDKQQQQHRNKGGLRRLNLEERRRRIARTQGWTRARVCALEVERVMQCMESVMQRQESFVDSLLEESVDPPTQASQPQQPPSPNSSGSIRDWDEDESLNDSEHSLLSVSRDFDQSLSNFDLLLGEESETEEDDDTIL